MEPRGWIWRLSYVPSMKPFSRHLLQLLLGALILHVLWLGGYYLIVSEVLPAPWTVYAHLLRMDGSSLLTHTLVSLERIGWGILIATLLASVIALVMMLYPRIGRVLSTFIYFSYPIPKLALLPVVMLLGGLGEITKVVMIVLIILFQLSVSMRDALLSIPREHFAVTRSLGAGALGLLRHLLLPAALPAALSALRIAIGTAISVLFVTETYGTTEGLGYYISDAWMRIDYLDMYGGIVLLSLLGVGLFILIDSLEALLCPWEAEED